MRFLFLRETQENPDALMSVRWRFSRSVSAVFEVGTGRIHRHVHWDLLTVGVHGAKGCLSLWSSDGRALSYILLSSPLLLSHLLACANNLLAQRGTFAWCDIGMLTTALNGHCESLNSFAVNILYHIASQYLNSYFCKIMFNNILSLSILDSINFEQTYHKYFDKFYHFVQVHDAPCIKQGAMA